MGKRVNKLTQATSLNSGDYFLIDNPNFPESKKILPKDIKLEDFNTDNFYNNKQIEQKLNNKVDKIEGKGLSTEDYTTAEKQKLSELQLPDQTYNPESENAQSGKAVAEALEQNIEELSKSLPYKLSGQTKLEQFVQKYQLKQNKYIDLSFIGNEKYFADLTTAVTAINSGNFDGALADETGANIVVFDGYDFYVIRMLNDITMTTSISPAKDFIFDFNGYTLTFDSSNENDTSTMYLFNYYQSGTIDTSLYPDTVVFYGMKESSHFVMKKGSALFIVLGYDNIDLTVIGGNYEALIDSDAAEIARYMFTVKISGKVKYYGNYEFYHLSINMTDKNNYSSTGTVVAGINLINTIQNTGNLKRRYYYKIEDCYITGDIYAGTFIAVSTNFNSSESNFIEANNVDIYYTAVTKGTKTGTPPSTGEVTSDFSFYGLRFLIAAFLIKNCKLIVQVPSVEGNVQINGAAILASGYGVIDNCYCKGNWEAISVQCYISSGVSGVAGTYDGVISFKNSYAASPDHGGLYVTRGNVYIYNATLERQFISGYYSGGYASSYFRNYNTSKELNVYINNSKFIGAYPAIAVSYDSNQTANNPYGTNVYVSNTEMYNNQCRVDSNNTLYVGNNVGTITNTVTSNPGTITTTTEDYPYVEPVLPSIPDVILGEQLLDPITVGNFSDMLYGRSYAYLQDNYKYIVDLFSKVIEAEGIDNLFEVGDLVVDDGALK